MNSIEESQILLRRIQPSGMVFGGWAGGRYNLNEGTSGALASPTRGRQVSTTFGTWEKRVVIDSVTLKRVKDITAKANAYALAA